VFFRHPSADMLLRPDELDPSYLAGARVLHTGSIILAAEPSRTATIEAIRRARAAGRLVCLDPNVRMSLWGSEAELRQVVLPLLRLADVVKLSEEDLASLVGTADAERGSAEVLAHGPRLVVVTRGKEGCLARSARGVLGAEGYTVDVVDTTGAGDAFVGGLLTGLLALVTAPAELSSLTEEDLGSALRLANATGALTTTARGAIPALPDRAAVRRFLLERVEPGAARLLERSRRHYQTS
jgi:fructokinase